MKKIIKEIIPYVVIAIVVILIRTFLVTPVRVDGLSMYPTLKDNEILILNKYDQSYKRFDIVVIKYKEEKLIKRVIGLPGENIEYKNNKLYINGKLIEEKFINCDTENFKLDSLGYSKIPNDYYFVVGDNRDNSNDSRLIGVISKKEIKGTVKISVTSFKKLK